MIITDNSEGNDCVGSVCAVSQCGLQFFVFAIQGVAVEAVGILHAFTEYFVCAAVECTACTYIT